MTVKTRFLQASRAAEKSLEFLETAESLAAQGKQDDARKCLKAVAMLATSKLYANLRGMEDQLAAVAAGEITCSGVDGPHHFTSAHEAVSWLWIYAMTMDNTANLTMRAGLMKSLGVNLSALRALVRGERQKLLGVRPVETKQTTRKRRAVSAAKKKRNAIVKVRAAIEKKRKPGGRDAPKTVVARASGIRYETALRILATLQRKGEFKPT